MKMKHWVFLLFAILGALFVFHVYSQHGGIAGVKSGVGLG
jgi:hypothetical protein